MLLLIQLKMGVGHLNGQKENNHIPDQISELTSLFIHEDRWVTPCQSLSLGLAYLIEVLRWRGSV